MQVQKLTILIEVLIVVVFEDESITNHVNLSTITSINFFTAHHFFVTIIYCRISMRQLGIILHFIFLYQILRSIFIDLIVTLIYRSKILRVVTVRQGKSNQASLNF
jgi:hypothetical protein